MTKNTNLKTLQRGNIPPALERFRSPTRLLCLQEDFYDRKKRRVVVVSRRFVTMKEYRKLLSDALDNMPVTYEQWKEKRRDG